MCDVSDDLDIDRNGVEGLCTWGDLIISGVSRSAFKKLNAISTSKNFFFWGGGALKSVQ